MKYGKIFLAFAFGGLGIYFMIFLMSFEIALTSLITFSVMGLFFEGIDLIIDKFHKEKEAR